MTEGPDSTTSSEESEREGDESLQFVGEPRVDVARELDAKLNVSLDCATFSRDASLVQSFFSSNLSYLLSSEFGQAVEQV